MRGSVWYAYGTRIGTSTVAFMTAFIFVLMETLLFTLLYHICYICTPLLLVGANSLTVPAVFQSCLVNVASFPLRLLLSDLCFVSLAYRRNKCLRETYQVVIAMKFRYVKLLLLFVAIPGSLQRRGLPSFELGLC